MKRILSLLLLVCLLAGCAPSGEILAQSNAPTAETTAVPTEAPTESGLKALIAVQMPDCLGIAAMGGDVLVFGKEKLTILDGATLETLVTERIPGLPEPHSGLVHVRSDRVAYFDLKAHRLVVLGTNLRESLRMDMPEDIVGSVCLSPDWKTVYYCTASGVRALEIGSGISRPVKEQANEWLGTVGVVLDGTVLHCMESTVRGDRKSVLLRVETGELLYEGAPLTDLQSKDGCVYGVVDHNSVQEIVFGEHEDTLKNLWASAVPENIALFPQWEGAVLTDRGEHGLTATLYHLKSGRKTAAVPVTDAQTVRSIAAGEDNGAIWLLSGERVYRWYPALSPVADENGYTAARITREKPDIASLAAMEGVAARLGSRYGISIMLGENAAVAAPQGYSFETEYIPQAYQKALVQLETLLSGFSAGFFAKAAEKSQNQILTLVLVRGIYGSEAVGERSSAPGTQYWKDGNLYVALQLGREFIQYFYHELGHVIDTRVLSTSTAYDEWETLNPPGFQYDNTYELYANRADSPWVQDSWFIDSYSMSFAVEDRCRIFEYACQPGNEALFAFPQLQSKLQQLCSGIRQTFGLTDADGAPLWEQYLQ